MKKAKRGHDDRNIKMAIRVIFVVVIGIIIFGVGLGFVFYNI